MRLEKQPAGIRITAEDEVYLDLTTAQYEDIYYAIPLDSSSLYLLLNGTVLTHADDRAILQFIVEANGGVDEAMKTLQALVQATPPPTATMEAEPAKPAEVNSFNAPQKRVPGPEEPPKKAPVLDDLDDEPFEITVNPTKPGDDAFDVATTPSKPAVDPFANLVKPAKAEEKPFEIKDVPKPAKPADLKPADVNAGRRPGTQVFSTKSAPPIKIEPQPDGKRVRISAGSKILDLGVVRYEDLYYAVPGDNASLYRLINDTILNRPEERDALKDLLGLLGGIDTGMTLLQEAVQKVEPPPKKGKSTPPSVGAPKTGSFGKSGSSAPAVGPRTSTFGGTTKPASTVQPVAPKPGIAAPAPTTPGLPTAPVAPAAGAKAPATVAGAGIRMPGPPASGGIAKPAAGGGLAKPPALPTAPAKAPSSPPAVPKGVPPKVAGPRPFTVDVPDEVDEVELVDDVEEIPVAPVDGGRPGQSPAAAKAMPAPAAKPPASIAKPGAPASMAKPGVPGSIAKPGAAPPASIAKPGAAPAPSMAKKKGKEIDRPAGQAAIKMSKEEMDKTGVKVKAVPNVGYQIICKEYFIQLSKAQYQELHYALPMPVMNMFKLVHNDLLKDPQSRGVLMKMIHLAGGPKDFMSALSLQVQAIKPTEDWQ